MKSPGRASKEFGFLSFYRDAFRTLVLRETPDEVAQVNGWSLHTDNVHLNSRGGLIIADLVQKFITARTTETILTSANSRIAYDAGEIHHERFWS